MISKETRDTNKAMNRFCRETISACSGLKINDHCNDLFLNFRLSSDELERLQTDKAVGGL